MISGLMEALQIGDNGADCDNCANYIIEPYKSLPATARSRRRSIGNARELEYVQDIDNPGSGDDEGKPADESCQ